MIDLTGAKTRKVVVAKTGGTKQNKTRKEKTAKKKKEVPSEVKSFNSFTSVGLGHLVKTCSLSQSCKDTERYNHFCFKPV